MSEYILKTNIYIIIETASRELYTSILMAVRMVEQDYRVYICSQSSIYRSLDKLPPGIIIDKGTGPDHIDFFKKAKENNHFIFILRSEPIAYNRELFKLYNHDLKSFKYVTKYLAIGPANYYDNISISVAKEKIKITGNPRFNFLNESEAKTRFKDNIDKINSKVSKFILFVSNFPDYIDGVKKNTSGKFEIISLVKSHGQKYNTNYNILLDAHHKFRQLIFVEFLNLLDALLIKFPQIDFIYRPHPSENPKKIKAYFKNFKNFKVIYTYSAIEWILASEASISNNCTTSIEAYLAGKPSVSYRPIKSNLFDIEETSNLSVNIENYDDMVSYINNLDSYKSSSMYLKTSQPYLTTKKYISYNNDYKSINKIINEINQVTINKSKRLEKRINVYSQFWKIITISKRIIARLTNQDTTFQKMKGFNLKSMNNHLYGIQKLSDLDTITKVEEVLNEIYLFDTE